MKHKLTRTNLMILAAPFMSSLLSNVVEDIIKGGEFILTAEDILEYLPTIPCNMLEEYIKPENYPYDWVLTKNVKLIYNNE